MLIGWALDIAFVALALATTLCVWRLLRGRDAVDRLVALDTLYIDAVAVLVVLGIRLHTGLLFEGALIVALLGYVSTTALARYLSRGAVIE